MAILRYVPKKKEIIDKRSESGGYYEAECDECGTIYYPTRANAKYCSRSCQVMAYRSGKTKKDSPSTPFKTSTTEPTGVIETFLGVNQLITYLQKYYYDDIVNKVGIYRANVKKLLVDKNYLTIGDVKIIRISERKLAIYRG